MACWYNITQESTTVGLVYCCAVCEWMLNTEGHELIITLNDAKFVFWIILLLQKLYVNTILGLESSCENRTGIQLSHFFFLYRRNDAVLRYTCVLTIQIIYMNKQPLIHYFLAYNLYASTKTAFNL